MRKIITLFLLCLAVNSYSQKPKNLLLEYNPQSAFLQFVSDVMIFNKNNVLIYEDDYGHYNSFSYNNAIGKKTAKLINVNDSDYPLKFILRGETLYTNNCNETTNNGNGIIFTLNTYNSPGFESLFACTASADIGAFSLENPETNDNISSCDVISIKNKKITTYYYKHPISGEWIDIYSVAPNAVISQTITTNDLNLKVNEIADLKDYYGPLFIKGTYTADGLYDTFVTTPEGQVSPINVYSETFETNIITYNITPCTPKITQISSLNYTNCSYSNDGAVTFTFERELQNEEQYEMSLMFENNAPVPNGNKTIPKDLMTTPTTYTWTNLPAENYKITYQTKKTIGNSEFMSDPEQKSFTILSPPPFSFSATEMQPKCNGEKGTITITASGGTPPYYYYLNNDPQIEFTSPKIIDVNAGDNYIKVVDSKSCIDNTKNDKKK